MERINASSFQEISDIGGFPGRLNKNAGKGRVTLVSLDVTLSLENPTFVTVNAPENFEKFIKNLLRKVQKIFENLKETGIF